MAAARSSKTPSGFTLSFASSSLRYFPVRTRKPLIPDFFERTGQGNNEAKEQKESLREREEREHLCTSNIIKEIVADHHRLGRRAAHVSKDREEEGGGGLADEVRGAAGGELEGRNKGPSPKGEPGGGLEVAGGVDGDEGGGRAPHQHPERLVQGMVPQGLRSQPHHHAVCLLPLSPQPLEVSLRILREQEERPQRVLFQVGPGCSEGREEEGGGEGGGEGEPQPLEPFHQRLPALLAGVRHKSDLQGQLPLLPLPQHPQDCLYAPGDRFVFYVHCPAQIDQDSLDL